MNSERNGRWRRALRLALARDTLLTGLKISLVVGTLLLCINQCAALRGEAELRLLEAVLTYMVPWLVSTWVTVRGEMNRPGIPPR